MLFVVMYSCVWVVIVFFSVRLSSFRYKWMFLVSGNFFCSRSVRFVVSSVGMFDGISSTGNSIS